MPTAATRCPRGAATQKPVRSWYHMSGCQGHGQLDRSPCSLVEFLELLLPFPTIPTIHLYPPFLLRTLCCPGLNIGTR